MPTIALLILSLDVQPILLDTLSVERAETLAVQRVLVAFVTAKPSYTLRGRTIIGAADQMDEAERGAVLVGNRHDIDIGKRIVVNGKLRVIHHRAGFVGDQFIPAWVEIRVEEVNE